MLLCRERRFQIQQSYLQNYNCTLLSFCMNIPGPIKTNASIRKAFELGKHELLSWINLEHITIKDFSEFHEKTGDELILALDCPAKKIKEKAVLLEETFPLGRLYDIDIINRDGTKLSRNYQRRCIICNKPAFECARSRSHAIEDLQNKVDEILQNIF